MSLWRRLPYLSPSRRRAAERDMQDEIDSLAEIAGRAELGNLTLARENAREAWGWSWLDGLLSDLKYAIRTLARQRSFTAVAVISLALGIGANAAIFSLMDTLLWRDLPVRDPERIVVFDNGSRSYFGYTRFAEGSGSAMDGVFGTATMPRMLDPGGGEQRGNISLVSGNYFEVLGVSAILGRTLAPDDDRRGAPARVAVLGYDYWQHAFAADRAVAGRTLHLDKAAFTVIGVAPPEFFGVSVGEVPDVFIPVTTLPSVMPGDDWLSGKNTNFLFIGGRLKPGISIQRASDQLTGVSIQIDIERNKLSDEEARRRGYYREKLSLLPAAHGISGMRDRFSKPLRAVFWMVALGLALACVNIMSLQFARADERRRELSVRLAIGAGRLRIARQLLTESMLIAIASGALGLALFHPVAHGLSGMMTMWGGQPIQLILPVDHNILLFVTAISVAAALLSGIAPALRATSGDSMPALQQGARGSSATPARRIAARIVAVVQIALSLLLVAGTCLFAYNLHRLRHLDSGIRRERLLVVDVDPAVAGYKDAALIHANMSVRERLAAIPGVEAVSFSQNGLYSGRNYDTRFDADGFPHEAPGNHRSIYDHVGPGFFTAVGARIIAGRDFDQRDEAGAPHVVILSRSLARRVFADRNPIGLNFYIATGPKTRDTLQIAGVVDDIRIDVREPQPMFFLCQLQSQVQAFSTRFLVRARTDSGAVAGAIRAAVREVNPALRVDEILSAEDLFDRTVDRDRLLAALAWGFGALALTLAAVGVYGLLSFDVTRRTGEIGIRMAVGARRADIMLLILREVALVSVIGLAIGIASASQMSKLVEGMVFGFKPGDPRVIAAAAAVLVAIATAAALIPARRAAKMDPMNALRCE